MKNPFDHLLLNIRLAPTLIPWMLVVILSGCMKATEIPTFDQAVATETMIPPVAATQPIASPQPAGSQATSTLVQPYPPQGPIFFDDFTYDHPEAMTANGWIVREKAGWPGVQGAYFARENVTFADDPDLPGNRLLQMTSTTDGTAEGTRQTQLCHQRKYLEGTYAARVRFSDAPISGPDGDQVVETFYMISPYTQPLDPDYSEMDFEYLPNGGWGHGETSFFVTTWETVQIEPWNADNTSNFVTGSLDGWHTLVVQAVGGEVNYLLDGELIASHRGKFFPEVPMSINFNLWFIQGGLLDYRETRMYRESIDWVYFGADVLLTPQQVEERVAAMRAAGPTFQDSVPPGDPPLISPCDL